MATSGDAWSGLKTVLGWIAVGVLAILAFKFLFFIAGFAWKALFFLLFTIAPLLLIGWLVVRALRYFSREV